MMGRVIRWRGTESGSGPIPCRKVDT